MTRNGQMTDGQGPSLNSKEGRTISPKGIVLFWSCNNAVALYVFPYKVELSSATGYQERRALSAGEISVGNQKMPNVSD